MQLDHLVIAAPSLEIGAAWFEAKTGVLPQLGGKHTLMGTHNLLVKLGADTYLEIISLDPEAAPPARARWFGLDAPILEPRLIHWVVRCSNLEAVTMLEPLGQITPITRGDFSWRITIPQDGSLPLGGVIPTLIEWQSANPSSMLEERGLVLQKLELWHPQPARVQAHLQVLPLECVVLFAPLPKLIATLETPRGLVILE